MDENKILEIIDFELCRLKDDKSERLKYIKNVIEDYYDCGFSNAMEQVDILLDNIRQECSGSTDVLKMS